MSALPLAWTNAKLGDVIKGFETGRNIQASGSPARDGEIGVLKISAVTWGRFQPHQNKALLPGDSPFEHETVQAGDLLISRANTTELVGAPVLVETSYPNLMLPDKILRVLYDPEVVDARYLLYALRSRNARLHLEAEATGTSDSMRNLSQPKLRETPIALAPLPEQRRIANKLDAVLSRLDACRDRLDRLPVILRRLRQAVLAAATSGSLTADWRADRGLSKDWRKCLLSEIADIQGGVTKDAKRESTADEELPYLRVANVQRGWLDLSVIKTIRVPADKVPALLLQVGDVLFNEGGDIDKVGRGWVWEGQIERCVFQNHVFRARLNDAGTQPKFISWWGNSVGLNYFLRGGKQTTNLASINKTVLSKLPILLPSPAEQAELVRRVESLFTLADTLEARLATARARVDRLTPALIAKAFRGELVPQDPNDEPAAILLKRISSATQTQVPGPKRVPSSRRTDLKPAAKLKLSDIISKMPRSDFTFDELLQVATGDYDSLKNELFALLADKKSGVEQFFDADVKSMRLRRTAT